jgi:hypothetical protein
MISTSDGLLCWAFAGTERFAGSRTRRAMAGSRHGRHVAVDVRLER